MVRKYLKFIPIYILILFAFGSCTSSDDNNAEEEMDYELPVISTTPISNLTSTSIKSGGAITDNGGSQITSNGVCYGKTENPTIQDNFTEDESVRNTFTSLISNLDENTVYYLRAYAKNAQGIAYGNEISFKTLSVDSEQSVLSTDLKKITISNNPTYNSIITVYTLDYDSNKKLTGLEINQENQTFGPSYAYYHMEYNNEGELIRALLDCSESNCGWNMGILPSNYVGITFDRSTENGVNIISINESELDVNRDYAGRIAGVDYQLSSENLILKQSETDILYENNNMIGIRNSVSNNDGLEYFDYDDKLGVINYSDEIGVIQSHDYIYRLMVGLKYSVNNYKRMKFDWKKSDYFITIEYDAHNRPIKRTTINKYNGADNLVYEEVLEYRDQ
ncbi:hypothetical protein [Maribacter sp. Hel_I_7]|uniref:hypothetical protein n=1 Tax=Maribacter sp. Hel_I_7 TaxID=1249997 RepID=UPI00047EC3C8|nr:hypothetical protein [Maribacter sp. Hel_I_7]